MKIRNKLGVLIFITLLTVHCNTKKLIEQRMIDSISLNAWIGEYVTDSLYIDSSEHRSNLESPPWYSIDYLQFRITIGKDSTYFTSYKVGNIGAEFSTFSYYCKTSIINDTLFLTTLKDVYNVFKIDRVNNFRPIRKPVVKLFTQDNKILATSINYSKEIKNYFLNSSYEEYGDTIEFRRVNYPLEHPKSPY